MAVVHVPSSLGSSVCLAQSFDLSFQAHGRQKQQEDSPLSNQMRVVDVHFVSGHCFCCAGKPPADKLIQFVWQVFSASLWVGVLGVLGVLGLGVLDVFRLEGLVLPGDLGVRVIQAEVLERPDMPSQN